MAIFKVRTARDSHLSWYDPSVYKDSAMLFCRAPATKILDGYLVEVESAGSRVMKFPFVSCAKCRKAAIESVG